MNSVDTRDETRKLRLYFLLSCLLLSILIQCWGLPKDDIDQLMALMMKQVQLLIPPDRNPFIELCVTKGEKCKEQQFLGSDAIFSWRPGIDSSAKLRFWGTYECVYQRNLQACPGDGGWTEWSAWSSCGAECEDKGWQTRTRICENPKPKFGGEPCLGMMNSNRSCIGSCRDNANGQEEAKEYMTQTHSVSPELEEICLKKHCFYEEVLKIIKDKSKVDKYWSSIICVKYNGPCPVNGGWGGWGEWSVCSVVCGHGEQYRKRECNSPAPKNGGIFCIGKYFETKICLAKQCTSNDAYTDWSEYSMCSESCGVYGVKTSIRSCLNDQKCYIGGTLVKEQVKTIPCYGGACPQIGGWGPWGPWAACSARCGDGRRGRMRQCDSPPPSNGEECPGAGVFVEPCTGSFCVQLPADTISNVRRRRSEIIFPSEMEYIEDYLPLINSGKFYSMEESYGKINQNENSSLRRTYSANDQMVQVLKDEPENEEYLSEFNNLVQNDTSAVVSNMDFRVASVNKDDNVFLPVTMGRNSKHLEDRNFTYDLHANREKRETIVKNKAQAPKIEEDDPFNLPLNPDLEPLYTKWSDWSHCNKHCGGGTRRRKRNCKDKKTVCRGEVWPMQFCNLDPCSVSGGWGSWMSWTPCSVTCGAGLSDRYRPCNNPLPKFGGSCSGVDSQSQPCSLPKCINSFSSWTRWTAWSACSTSCGGGFRRKKRYQLKIGIMAVGLCNAFPCSEKGLWAAWGGWSTCSRPCGLGTTFRDRTCTDPAPTYGGDPCEGPGSELQTCFAGPCFDEDDYGVLILGTGYLKYADRGAFAGFFMVYLKIKLLQGKGTLFHHTSKCKGNGITDCELSILLSMVGRNAQLEIKAVSNKPQTMLSSTNLEIDLWHDIFVIVTESWVGMRVNDDTYTEKRFSTRFKHGINFDGTLFVGANRLKQDGIHGVIGVLRRNFKVLLLFSMKSWLGYGAPVESNNVNKFQLPLTVRHSDFKGKYYSHLFFRKANFVQVLIIFHITGINGLLLFNGGMETNSSFVVTIKDGALEFCLNCGEKLFCRKAYELKIGQWYILRISVTGNEEQIRMNDGDAMQVMCPVGDKYIPRSSMYVGGAGSIDWKIIVELTKNDLLFQGMIDTLVVNDLAVTYKMATLIDTEGMVNSLGYSLADHVTEVLENDKATATLRCGVPGTVTNSHLVRIIWLHNMRRIVSGTGTEIVDSDSLNQTVSTITLYSSHHYEGVYACLLSTDGVLVNMHVFVLTRYHRTDGDGESLAEWILFIILLVLIVFICCPLVIYCCTKNHPFWNKFKGIFTKKKPGQAENQPLMKGSDTSGSTSGRESSGLDTSGASSSGASSSGASSSGPGSSKSFFSRLFSSGTDTPKTDSSVGNTSGTSTSGRNTPVSNTSSANTSGENTPVSYASGADTLGGTFKTTPESVTPGRTPMDPECTMAMGDDMTTCEDISAAWMNSFCMDESQMSAADSFLPLCSQGKKLTFADQIAIVMPPFSDQVNLDPDFQEGNRYFDLNSDYPCPPYFQECDPYSAWEINEPSQPSHPNFAPRDIYGIPDPHVIQHIDYLRNPYYLSGICNQSNVNQNNPATDHSTNNATSDYSNSMTGDQCSRPASVESKESSLTDKKYDLYNCKKKRMLNEKEACSRGAEIKSSETNSTRKTCEDDRSVHFDSEFACSSERKEDLSSNLCNVQMMSRKIDASNNKKSRKIKYTDSSQNAEMKKEDFASISKENRKSKLQFCRDQSYYSFTQDLRPSQQLHKCHPHRRREAVVHLEKHVLMQSVPNDECKNLVSTEVHQNSKILTGQRADIDSELIRENESIRCIPALQMLTPTTDAVRSMARRHLRTKSVSKGPDTSSDVSDHRVSVHEVYQSTITTSSQTHSPTMGTQHLQL